MKRQKIRHAQSKQTTRPDPQQENQQDDFSDVDIPPALDTFFSAANFSDQPIKIVLYRNVAQKAGAGRPKRFFLEEYETIPTFNEIGEAHGGGEYEIIAIAEADPDNDKPKIFKTARFNIDSRFDAIRDAIKAASIKPQQTAPGLTAADSFQQGLSMVTGLVQAIAPLITSRQQADSNPAPLLTAMAEIGNNMLTTSFKTQMENQKMLIDTLRENTPAIAGDEEPEDKTFDKIMKALELFAPMFLKAPDSLKPTMINAAKAQPDVKAILHSKIRKQALKKKLIDKFGENQAREIFKVFDTKQDNATGQKIEAAATK